MTQKRQPGLVVFILYDGVENSVFEGQVLQPLLSLGCKTNCKVLLISFEKKPLTQGLIKRLAAHKNLELVVLKKRIFWGLFSLLYAIRLVHGILTKLPRYVLHARGPHAGWIALHASKKTECTQIRIQARGILPEEYAFVHKTDCPPLSWLYTWRKRKFELLERVTYSYNYANIPIIIEAVSKALKDYIIDHYNIPAKKFDIANSDIPQTIPRKKLQAWRTSTRLKLRIQQEWHVYCYNGSAKGWQCPEDVVNFFAQQYKKEHNSFLLVLTQDQSTFKQLLKKTSTDPSHFYVCSVNYQEIFKYLAACDTGLVFREKNILNWVARPTKVLEYRAVGLNIVHNGTIALLQEEQFFIKTDGGPNKHVTSSAKF